MHWFCFCFSRKSKSLSVSCGHSTRWAAASALRLGLCRGEGSWKLVEHCSCSSTATSHLLLAPRSAFSGFRAALTPQEHPVEADGKELSGEWELCLRSPAETGFKALTCAVTQPHTKKVRVFGLTFCYPCLEFLILSKDSHFAVLH